MALINDANFLSKLGCFHICSPTRYYTCFPLYKYFFMLVVDNVSLGCLLCLVDCFFCLLLLGVWSNEDDIEFSSLSSSGLSWHSLMGRISNEFFNGILESCWWLSLIFLFLPAALTFMKFSVLSLASWVFICWTDKNSNYFEQSIWFHPKSFIFIL